MSFSRLFFSAVLLIGGAGLTTASSAAGISLGGTRLIFDGAKNAASISVSNSSSEDVWLMRFWVSPYEELADKDKQNLAEKKLSALFIVTPPLYRLDPQAAVQLRVNKVSDSLPSDKESVYYLNSLAIPPKKGEKGYEKSVQSGLQFAVNTRIKLIYRPTSLSDRSAIKSLPGKLTVSASGKELLVKNPTPYYITLVQISVDGKAIQTDKDTMLSPFGTLSLPSNVAHGQFSYQTVDDNGARTPVTEKTF